MRKVIPTCAVISIVLAIVFAIAYRGSGSGLFETLAITFGTIAYHFVMRLVIGGVVDVAFQNQMDYNRPWFQEKRWENSLYKRLKVKQWKGKMPTYREDYFNPKKHSWKEIAMAMCQAEIGHEIIICFCFLPIVAGVWFGAWPAFIITSVISAAIESLFVMMQRYNRPRIVRLLK